MRAMPFATLLAILVPAATAAAQPGRGPAPAAPLTIAPAPVPTGAVVEAGIRDDAGSGRVFMSPTALTPPAGTFSLQSVQLGIVGASFSLLDEVAISVNTLVPLPGAPRLVIGTLKVKVVDVGRFKLAAHANVDYIDASVEQLEDGGLESDAVRGGLALLGGAATYCLDRECHSLVNGYLAGGVALDTEVDRRWAKVFAAAAWVQRLRGRMKLVAEVLSENTFKQGVGASGNLVAGGGLRFTARDGAIDLALLGTGCDDCDAGIQLGPWISFLYRAY